MDISTSFLNPSSQTLLGWICQDMEPITQHKNAKHLKLEIQKIISTFTAVMIETAVSILYTPDDHRDNKRQRTEVVAAHQLEALPVTDISVTTDGAFNPDRPNSIGIGLCIALNGKIIRRQGKLFTSDNIIPPGTQCNSLSAEYLAYTLANLELAALDDKYPTVLPRRAYFFSDSETICNQIDGTWHINSQENITLATEARKARSIVRLHGFLARTTWFPRAMNTTADALATKALKGMETDETTM